LTISLYQRGLVSKDLKEGWGLRRRRSREKVVSSRGSIQSHSRGTDQRKDMVGKVVKAWLAHGNRRGGGGRQSGGWRRRGCEGDRANPFQNVVLRLAHTGPLKRKEEGRKGQRKGFEELSFEAGARSGRKLQTYREGEGV